MEKIKFRKNNTSEFTTVCRHLHLTSRPQNLGINMNFLKIRTLSSVDTGRAKFCNERYAALCVSLTRLRIEFADGFQFIVK